MSQFVAAELQRRQVRQAADGVGQAAQPIVRRVQLGQARQSAQCLRQRLQIVLADVENLKGKKLPKRKL